MGVSKSAAKTPVLIVPMHSMMQISAAVRSMKVPCIPSPWGVVHVVCT